VLTLHDVGPETIYFSDRPARRVGLLPTGEFLEALGFTPGNPPNAALATETDNGDREVLVIELFASNYDEATSTLTYEAGLLAEYGAAALADLAEHATGELLPPSFGRGHLFIDSCSADDWPHCILI
jgi:hypothetical protein